LANILTPVTLWKDFNNNLPLNESIIKELTLDGIIYTEVYFSGRETSGGRPRIYALYAKIDDSISRPALLIIPDYDKSIDMELITRHVKKGFNVLMIDYAGEFSKRERFTKYPQNIEYANFLKAGRRIDFVDESAFETSWYEWVSVAKYAVNYLIKIQKAEKIGVLGIRHGAEIMWQLISTESKINCAISLFGFGWEAYRGDFKYNDISDIKLDDERYRFIAGVDAHAYAPYAKCPVLLLTSTNDSHFDVDRAFDTLARVNPEVESMGNFSLKYDGFLGSNSLKDIDVFLEKYLKDLEIPIPKSIDISIEYEKDEYIIKTKYDCLSEILNYDVYYSEGTINPALRDWIKAEEFEKTKDKIVFKTELCNSSDYIFAFAKAEYKSGLTLSSKITTKKIEKVAKNIFPKSRVIYTSKKQFDAFTVITPKNIVGDILFDAGELPVKMIEGPFGISGIYSKYGLKSYRVGSKRYKADENSILKLDAYSKTFNKLKITVITDYLSDNSKTYFSEIILHGGEIWQSIQLESIEFKTEIGQPLKSFINIDVMTFEGITEFAINNIIWL
jgi:dienelactone hydrolase